MDTRRKHKNARDEQGKTQYKRLKKEVQIKGRKARNNWMERKFKEVEMLFRMEKYIVNRWVKHERSLYSNIEWHRDRLIGHKFRHEGLVGTILEGTVDGRKRKGRQR